MWRASRQACGHRWSDVRYRNHRFPNGVCYTLNADLEFASVAKRLPMVKSGLQVAPGGMYYYAMGQLGLSTHFTKVRPGHSVLQFPGGGGLGGVIVGGNQVIKVTGASALNIQSQICTVWNHQVRHQTQTQTLPEFPGWNQGADSPTYKTKIFCPSLCRWQILFLVKGEFGLALLVVLR